MSLSAGVTASLCVCVRVMSSPRRRPEAWCTNEGLPNPSGLRVCMRAHQLSTESCRVGFSEIVAYGRPLVAHQSRPAGLELAPVSRRDCNSV